MEGRRGDGAGTRGPGLDHPNNLRLGTGSVKYFLMQSHPRSSAYFFAMVFTIETIPMSPMDFPMESSLPKTL